MFCFLLELSDSSNDSKSTVLDEVKTPEVLIRSKTKKEVNTPKAAHIPERAEESWKDKDRKQFKTEGTSNLHTLHRIPWGGRVKVDNQLVKITNTCPFDNILQILYTLYKLNARAKAYMDNLALTKDRASICIRNIFREIDRENYVTVKTLCTRTLVRKWHGKDPLTSNDFYGPEETIVEEIAHWFEFESEFTCSKGDCQVSKHDVINSLGFCCINPDTFAFFT